MKCIKLFLGEREVGRAYEGRFVDMVSANPFGINARSWYEDCFYGVDNDGSFESRFQCVLEGKCMCFSKPSLIICACEVDE